MVLHLIKVCIFLRKLVHYLASFFENIETLSNEEIAFKAIQQFVSGIVPDDVLKTILKEVLDFDFPVVEITPNIANSRAFSWSYDGF